MSMVAVVVAVALISAALKAAGPMLLLDRTFPPRMAAVIDALAPALLAGLVVVELLGHHWEDADATVLPGLLVGVAARWRTRLPDTLCVALAVGVTIGVRSLTG